MSHFHQTNDDAWTGFIDSGPTLTFILNMAKTPFFSNKTPPDAKNRWQKRGGSPNPLGKKENG